MAEPSKPVPADSKKESERDRDSKDKDKEKDKARREKLSSSSNSNTTSSKKSKREGSTQLTTQVPAISLIKDASPIKASRKKRDKDESELPRPKRRSDDDADDEIEEFKFEVEEEGEQNIFTASPHGFLDFLDNSKFSDTTLVFPNGTEFKCHRMILAFSSQWFYDEFMRLEKGSTSSSDGEIDDDAFRSPRMSSSLSPRKDYYEKKKDSFGGPRRSKSTGIKKDRADEIFAAEECAKDSSSVPSSPRDSLVLSTTPSLLVSSHPEPIHENLIVKLQWIGDERCFLNVLKWMYSGVIAPSVSNCVQYSVIAERYQINALSRICRVHISSNLQRETAIDVLLEAIKFNAQVLVRRCVGIVARNFCHIKNINVKPLPYDALKSILQHRHLAITDEFALYKVVCDYVTHHQSTLSDVKVLELMQNVRFRWLSFDELEQVAQNPLVPRSVVIEATMARLTNFECAADEVEKRLAALPPRLQPRPKRSLVFDFNKDSPEFFHGIVGYIATGYGKGDWKNPHIAGRVKVHSSSLTKGSRSILVDKTPAQVWTNNFPSSWFSIDFGPHRRITPSFLSLRHGANYKADSLRTFDAQASNDGVRWTTIKKFSNDRALNGPFATASWPIEGVKDSFRFFRILQPSHNSSNRNFLVISGIEIFGMLDSS